MAEAPPGFGDAQSIDGAAAAGEETITTLRQLVDQVSRDVTRTVPDHWGGRAAGAFGRFWAEYLSCLGTYRSANGAWCRAMRAAAQTTATARQQLVDAHRFATANGMDIAENLAVVPREPAAPGMPELVGQAQQAVDAAVRTAEQAREQIRAANEAYTQNRQQLTDSLETLRDVLERRAGGGRSNAISGKGRPGRPTSPQRQRLRDLTVEERLYEGKLRLPAAKWGEWIKGQPGDGIWRPHRPGNFGLQWPNDTITWRSGVPDLREHTMPTDRMPDGRQGWLDGLRGLDGTWSNDSKLADEALAARFGRTPEWVTQWRRDEGLTWHHYSNSELQLVPTRIHNSLPHEGSATDLRR